MVNLPSCVFQRSLDVFPFEVWIAFEDFGFCKHMVATALAAARGVGVGAIIRNQVGAIVTVLALLYVAEPLLGFIPHAGTAVQKYGLGGLAAAATRTTGFPATAQLLGQGAAVLVLAAYAAAVLLAGAALLRHRDITA